ncbi:MAG: PQQ-dependent sugar dehydrogenase [Gammaproteobacteria bacterium]
MNNIFFRLKTLVFLTVMALNISLPTSANGANELTNPIPASIPAGAMVKLEMVASGMVAPNWGTAAPGDDDRLFVVDQTGILWAVDLESGDKTVFANLSALLVPLGVGGPGTFDERGFLGLAFHPNYQNNGLLYTYTSELASGGEPDFPVPFGAGANNHIVVSEWRVPNPHDRASVVDPGSRRVLMRIGDPQFNHNAGALNFGKDMKLYIAVGDGGAADDQGAGHSPRGNGQDLSNLLGKILRIDPLGNNAPNHQYGIPADNPFLAAGAPPTGGAAGCADGACDEIYAFGFRNPFRFTFDAATGDMYAADVGQNDIEELDVVVAGGNYGWPVKEGSFCFDANGTNPGFVTDAKPCANEPPMLIDPVAEYDHDEGISIIGGFVYRGNKVPELMNRYVFGDYARRFGGNNGRLFYLDKRNIVRGENMKKSSISELRIYGQDGLGMSLLGFGTDAKGEIYVMANMTGVPSGETGVVMRIDSLARNKQTRNFRTRLIGAEQVPVAIDTQAKGHAHFQLSQDGTELKVQVVVSNIKDVIGAHIHRAPAGANGPIVASFIPDTAGFLSGGPFVANPINTQGVLVRGTITATDLVGPLAGMRMKALVDAMRSGNTYFNVHTTEHRGGEIRGQID